MKLRCLPEYWTPWSLETMEAWPEEMRWHQSCMGSSPSHGSRRSLLSPAQYFTWLHHLFSELPAKIKNYAWPSVSSVFPQKSSANHYTQWCVEIYIVSRHWPESCGKRWLYKLIFMVTFRCIGAILELVRCHDLSVDSVTAQLYNRVLCLLLFYNDTEFSIVYVSFLLSLYLTKYAIMI